MGEGDGSEVHYYIDSCIYNSLFLRKGFKLQCIFVICALLVMNEGRRWESSAMTI